MAYGYACDVYDITLCLLIKRERSQVSESQKRDRSPWWAVSSAIIARENESTPEKK